jgi:formylglycine-generating enzyme required for sulfatase activity
MRQLTLILLLLSLTALTKTIAQSKDLPIEGKRSFRDCPDCPEMVIIPAGAFMMGSPDTDSAGTAQEKPQHQVHIAQFAAGKYDITRKEWEAFVTATDRPVTNGCAWTMVAADSGAKPWSQNPHASWRNLGFEQQADHPVVCLSWKDAQDYIEWLSKKSDKQYRLLTEGEWEYAARAGSTNPFPWGTNISHENANYGKETCCAPLASGRDKWLYTSPVNAFPPNRFGLYDMHGNVLQFVQDNLSESYANTPTDGTAYKVDAPLKMTGRFAKMSGMPSANFHIVRGGDWGDTPAMLRSSARNWSPGPGATTDTYRSAGLGFRVARSL